MKESDFINWFACCFYWSSYCTDITGSETDDCLYVWLCHMQKRKKALICSHAAEPPAAVDSRVTTRGESASRSLGARQKKNETSIKIWWRTFMQLARFLISAAPSQWAGAAPDSSTGAGTTWRPVRKIKGKSRSVWNPAPAWGSVPLWPRHMLLRSN